MVMAFPFRKGAWPFSVGISMQVAAYQDFQRTAIYSPDALEMRLRGHTAQAQAGKVSYPKGAAAAKRLRVNGAFAEADTDASDDADHSQPTPPSMRPRR